MFTFLKIVSTDIWKFMQNNLLWNAVGQSHSSVLDSLLSTIQTDKRTNNSLWLWGDFVFHTLSEFEWNSIEESEILCVKKITAKIFKKLSFYQFWKENYPEKRQDISCCGQKTGSFSLCYSESLFCWIIWMFSSGLVDWRPTKTWLGVINEKSVGCL